jgi:hypothetical protein
MIIAVVLLLGCTGARDQSASDTQAPFVATLDTSILLPFEARTSLVWSDPSHIALIDGDRKQLVLVGLDGTERRVGGPGDGPGEYHFPQEVLRLGSGELLVSDPSARRIQWFDRGLRPVRQMNTPHLVNRILGFRGDSLTLMRQIYPADSLGRVISTLTHAGQVVAVSWRLGTLDPVFNEVAESEPGQLVSDPQVALRSDNVLVLGESRDYRLWLVTIDGKTLATGGRPEIPATDAPVASESEIQDGIAEARRRTDDPEMLKQAEQGLRLQSGAPRYKFRHLALDPERRLWVLGDRGSLDSTEVDLFDPQLRYLGTIPLPGAIWALAVEGRRLAALSGTPGDEPWILNIYSLRPVGAR